MQSSKQSNPYESPQTIQSSVERTTISLSTRSIPLMILFLAGGAIGAISFAISLFMVPTHVPNLTEHDLRLANHLGFVFPISIGIWAGFVRRSIIRTFLGVICGLLIGILYSLLCESRDFMAIMIGFPTLLGGVTSILLGKNYSAVFIDTLLRFIKGIISGFVLGLCYMIILDVLIDPASTNTVADYHQAMWSAGLIAMTIASALYLILFHWSANLYPNKEIADNS